MKQSLVVFIVALLVFSLTVTAVLSFTVIADNDATAEVLGKHPGRSNYSDINFAVIESNTVALRKRPGRAK